MDPDPSCTVFSFLNYCTLHDVMLTCTHIVLVLVIPTDREHWDLCIFPWRRLDRKCILIMWHVNCFIEFCISLYTNKWISSTRRLYFHPRPFVKLTDFWETQMEAGSWPRIDPINLSCVFWFFSHYPPQLWVKPFFHNSNNSSGNMHGSWW